MAVGDEAFQAKCFERIETYQTQGMTTLLVTHNSERIRKVCHQVLWLEKGGLKMFGPTDEVVNGYVATIKPGTRNPRDRPFAKK